MIMIRLSSKHFTAELTKSEYFPFFLCIHKNGPLRPITTLQFTIIMYHVLTEPTVHYYHGIVGISWIYWTLHVPIIMDRLNL